MGDVEDELEELVEANGRPDIRQDGEGRSWSEARERGEPRRTFEESCSSAGSRAVTKLESYGTAKIEPIFALFANLAWRSVRLWDQNGFFHRAWSDARWLMAIKRGMINVAAPILTIDFVLSLLNEIVTLS